MAVAQPGAALEFACPTVVDLYEATGLSDETRSTGWRTALETFAAGTTLRDLVAPILANDELVRDVARLSYKHNLGFDKIILLRDEFDAMIKLDVWWPDHRVNDNIHSHRWDFSSIVLAGRLNLKHFSPARSSEEVQVYRISVPPRPTDADPIDIALACTWDGDLVAGSSYDLDYRQFHTSNGTSGLATVTLVAQARPRRHYSETVATGGPPAAGAPPQAFEVDELRSRLAKLIELAA